MLAISYQLIGLPGPGKGVPTVESAAPLPSDRYVTNRKDSNQAVIFVDFVDHRQGQYDENPCNAAA